MRLIAVMIRAAFVEHRRMDVMVQNRALTLSLNPVLLGPELRGVLVTFSVTLP